MTTLQDATDYANCRATITDIVDAFSDVDTITLADSCTITSDVSGLSARVSEDSPSTHPDSMNWTVTVDYGNGLIDTDSGHGVDELVVSLHNWIQAQGGLDEDEEVGEVHTEVLTSPGGERTVRVTWMEKVVTGLNDSSAAPDPTAWDEDECPVVWDYEQHRATNVWKLTDYPRSWSGSTMIVVHAAPVDSVDELRPGTYVLEEIEDAE